tara:strand:- start:25 stop:447 length:423 start_codon:yes stop_codon:yes gene_type:complete
MKKSKFRFIIREIVREEVAFAIREIFKPEEKVVRAESVIKNSGKKKRLRKKPVNRYYTNNKKLNQMLNETADSGEWETMGDGVYTTDRAEEMLSEQYKEQPTQVIPDGVNSNNIPEHLMNVFNRDYSGLVKTMREKKGGV